MKCTVKIPTNLYTYHTIEFQVVGHIVQYVCKTRVHTFFHHCISYHIHMVLKKKQIGDKLLPTNDTITNDGQFSIRVYTHFNSNHGYDIKLIKSRILNT